MGARRRGAEEAREQLGLIVLRHPNARVFDVYLHKAIRNMRRHVYVTLERIFECVRQQVRQDLRQPARIGWHIWQVVRNV